MSTIFYTLALVTFSIFSPASYSSYPSHTPDADFIKKVRFPTNQLPEGRFSDASLPRFLAAAYAQHKITSPDFKDLRCIKAKNLLTKAGWNTIQLLKVTAGCGGSVHEYIVKEGRDSMIEAISLEAIKNRPGIKAITAPHERAGFPVLALPIAILSVAGHDEAPIVTLAPLAKGEEFCNFINKHKRLASKADESAVQKAYFELGRELSNLHREFRTVHRDLKCLNMFYDGTRYTEIDLDTMAPSFQEPQRCDAEGDDGKCKVHASDPSQDYEKILFGNFAKNESKEVQEMFNGANLSLWYNIAFYNFVLGFLETYPSTQRREVLSGLRRTFSADFAGFSMDYDKEKIDEVRAKYLIPILDKVESTLPK